MPALLTFLDIESDPRTGKILDIGASRSDGTDFHRNDLLAFLEIAASSDFLVGHNIFRHDLRIIGGAAGQKDWGRARGIDTLLLSPLLFPTFPYHKLVKDDHFLPEERNNPLEDALKARDLFYNEVAAFNALPADFQSILYGLLGRDPEFACFFTYLRFSSPPKGETLEDLVRRHFSGSICSQAPLAEIISQSPVSLAYSLALIRAGDRYSITPPWVVYTFPDVETVLRKLRNEPCEGCAYCNEALSAIRGLKRFFGYDAYRAYEGRPLQEEAVNAALRHRSLLAVFPTGGGKSVTFQVPALLSGENARALTVVISPLQSLMKDQVDNLERKEITDAVTINGLLDPIERQKSIERVQGTSKDSAVAHILYISPESLRSITIEKLLLGRKIARFVIDEAHCFSTWGQDFRVDYQYIGDFLRMLQEKKGLKEPIPVSCFTATAKPQVIEDIRAYFREKLGLEMDLFQAGVARKNLHYRVLPKDGDDDKYLELRRLIEEKSCPTIVYVSRTRRAEEIAGRLSGDGFRAGAYHAKMDRDKRVASQDAFLKGEVDVMVATSAFGMGVDKEDVGRVIHYNISDSLENYMQEAGRAGRNERTDAECFVLFQEEDLDKHFALLNATKLDVKEINQIWKAVKDLATRVRPSISQSALEIARKAGWDEGVRDLETRVKTAIAALEDAGFLERGQNAPQVFANSILARNIDEAVARINASAVIPSGDKEKAIRIMKKLFSSKSRRQADESAESRVDYISDHLGIDKEDVIRIVTLLRDEQILANAKDLTAFIRRQEQARTSLTIAENFRQLELCLAGFLEEGQQNYNLKDWNEKAMESGCSASPNRIRTLLNFWAMRNWISKHGHDHSRHYVAIRFDLKKPAWMQKMEQRHLFGRLIIEYLFEKVGDSRPVQPDSDEVLVEFSVLELKNMLHERNGLFGNAATIEDVEDTLFYLSRIEALKLEGGFLVTYNRLKIRRIELNNRIQYSKSNYLKLAQHYQNKIQQIHIVGEYARKMIRDYEEALRFVDDYFRLSYTEFLRKHFPNGRESLQQTMTPKRFEELFGALSPAQLQIIRDRDHQHIVVAAGPGSGKTRVLAHKLASILLTEDVRYEQMLMLTFSRAAATEFKKRLLHLIGKDAHQVEIKTFHSYCFDLLGKNGSIENSDSVIPSAIERIRNGEVERNRITKSVLVVDEAQDMAANEYELVQSLIGQNEDMRVLLVGDDDQNIYAFRRSDSAFMKAFIDAGARKYELVENYRSVPQVVAFANSWVKQIRHRLKEMPIMPVYNDPGTVRISEHTPQSLAVPVANELEAAPFEGSTCILTYKNSEAEKIAAYLKARGWPSRLIQDHDSIALRELHELRFFSGLVLGKDDNPVIPETVWAEAKDRLLRQFARSSKLDWFLTVIGDFETVNPERKYKSDWSIFLKESKWEDFIRVRGEVIYVSTIHKSKGREFDRVILSLEKFVPQSDDDRRLLYVAVTRAKKMLSIHYAAHYLRPFASPGLTYVADTLTYPDADRISHILNYPEVDLGFFAGRQQPVSELRCGDSLQVKDSFLLNRHGVPVLRFSKAFREKIAQWAQRGYYPTTAVVQFMAYWKGRDMEQEILICFPELYLQKAGLAEGRTGDR